MRAAGRRGRVRCRVWPRVCSRVGLAGGVRVRRSLPPTQLRPGLVVGGLELAPELGPLGLGGAGGQELVDHRVQVLILPRGRQLLVPGGPLDARLLEGAVHGLTLGLDRGLTGGHLLLDGRPPRGLLVGVDGRGGLLALGQPLPGLAGPARHQALPLDLDPQVTQGLGLAGQQLLVPIEAEHPAAALLGELERHPPLGEGLGGVGGPSLPLLVEGGHGVGAGRAAQPGEERLGRLHVVPVARQEVLEHPRAELLVPGLADDADPGVANVGVVQGLGHVAGGGGAAQGLGGEAAQVPRQLGIAAEHVEGIVAEAAIGPHRVAGRPLRQEGLGPVQVPVDQAGDVPGQGDAAVLVPGGHLLGQAGLDLGILEGSRTLLADPAPHRVVLAAVAALQGGQPIHAVRILVHAVEDVGEGLLGARAALLRLGLALAEPGIAVAGGLDRDSELLERGPLGIGEGLALAQLDAQASALVGEREVEPLLLERLGEGLAPGRADFVQRLEGAGLGRTGQPGQVGPDLVDIAVGDVQELLGEPGAGVAVGAGHRAQVGLPECRVLEGLVQGGGLGELAQRLGGEARELVLEALLAPHVPCGLGADLLVGLQGLPARLVPQDLGGLFQVAAEHAGHRLRQP